jgi:methylmalonyl-CoA/ethylmalonyl-CoA epimerase
MRFDHIGLFVSELSHGRERLAALLSIARFSDEINDPLLHVRVQFCIDASGISYELVAPLGEDNPVSAVLASGRNILNHVAYRVDSLEAAMASLRKQGSVPVGAPAPAVAFAGARVAFFLTPLRFLIELIEDAPPDRAEPLSCKE